jgi:ribosomal protein L32E
MARKKFLRGKWRTASKLGRGRKKKQKYRKAKGRHNKIRENNRGNPVLVGVGYKKQKKAAEIKVIYNIKELFALGNGEKIILGKIGQKKKLEIIEKSKEKNIKIINLRIKKLMAKIEKVKRERKAKKDKKTEKEKIKKEEKKGKGKEKGNKEIEGEKENTKDDKEDKK